MRLRSPRVALGHGIAYASENRRTEGLIGDLSVRANIVLAMQSARGWARAIPRRQQAELADRYIEGPRHPPGRPRGDRRATCRGGNQQKVLLARWLLTGPEAAASSTSRPGASTSAPRPRSSVSSPRLADDGMSVLFISAELEEVLRLSHRIVVMRELHKVAEIDNRGTTVDDLMRLHRRGRRHGRRGGSAAS